MKLALGIALLCLCAGALAEDWCVNAGIYLNIRYTSCSNAPAYVANPGTCFTRTSGVQYCSGLRYYNFNGGVTACTESAYMHPCTCNSSPPPVPNPPPSGGGCTGQEWNRIRNTQGWLGQYVGQTKCSPWNSGFCGQCTHFVWWATGNRQNVGDWKKVRDVPSAISTGNIAGGDAIATFNGGYAPCGYGGHTAIFDYYDSAYNRIFVYHQNWDGVTSIAHGAIWSFGSYYTMSAYSTGKRAVTETLALTAVAEEAGECVNPQGCTATPTCTFGACDDGNPCTTNDFCLNGVCQGVYPDGECESTQCVDASWDAETCECVRQPLAAPQGCDFRCTRDGQCNDDGECVEDPDKSCDTEVSDGNELASSASGSCSYPVLRRGASGSRDVFSLQYLLRYRGFLSGSVDGIFGGGTEAAVVAFQRSRGLAADGIVGSGTWGQLIVTVSSGSVGDHARAVQDQLRYRYSYSISVDGNFGPNSATALRSYQSANGLSSTGSADSSTWRSLLDATCSGGGSTGGGSTGGGATVQQRINERGCSTRVLAGLSRQLSEGLSCPVMGLGQIMTRLDTISGVSLNPDAAAVPYLQTSAANAVRSVVNSISITVNSALRTLPQQLMLYKWGAIKVCNINKVAPPGGSNHNGGLAMDVSNWSSARSTLENNGFRWYGTGDEVHFDYIAGGRDIRSKSVEVFQRLWNLNNPYDQIGVDGSYGPTTESKMLQSPADGFRYDLC